jgi:nicotinamide mononucleotide transporter
MPGCRRCLLISHASIAVMPGEELASAAIERMGGVMTGLSNFMWFEAFSILGAPVTVIEIIGFLSGAWCVWLVGRQNPWNWPVGLIQVVAYCFLFWTVGLYADSSLQLVYVALGLWGWWNWLRRRPGNSRLAVRRSSKPEWAWMLAVGALGAIAIWWVLVTFTQSTVPVADATTTSLSLMATYAMGRKIIESWWLWIAADLIYVPLYAYKSLWLTALLYGFFLALCIVGLRRWQRDLDRTVDPDVQLVLT